MDKKPDAPAAADAARRLRGLVALALSLAVAIFAFSAAAGLTGSWPTALALAALAAAATAWAAWRHPIVELDPGSCSRGLEVISALATVAALVQLARLTVFMVAPSEVGYSTMPWSRWEVRHSCLSAYYVAAQAAGESANVYDDALYSLPSESPTALRRPRTLGPFNIDVYEYPPPFLLLPRLLRLLAPDFVRLRALWFGLNGVIVLAAMLAVARTLGPASGTRALLLAPLALAAVPMLNTLQKGNIQVTIIALSMLAMLLFARGRGAAGGALLAYAAASKLYPGMLVVYLLARRRWGAVVWTAAWGLVLVLLTLLDVGAAPFAAFVEHLPRLLSGEAFPAFRNPVATAVNFSVPGLVFKLKLFGVPGMGFPAAKVVGWIYTVFVVWATVVLARRAQREGDAPQLWLAILILATLRSPFLPLAYAPFPSLWLLTLLAATRVPGTKTLVLTLATWVCLNVYVSVDSGLGARSVALITGLPQALTMALALFVLWRPSPSAAPSP